MKSRFFLIGIPSLIAGILILPYLTLCLIPDSTLMEAFNSILSRQGLTVGVDHLGRSFPFGITATNLVISARESERIHLDSARISLRLLPLFSGKLALNSASTLKSATIRGSVTVWPDIQGQFVAENLNLSDVPMLASLTGGTVKGISRIDLSLKQNGNQAVEGVVKLHVRSLELRNTRISSLQLPDVTAPELRGLLKLKGQTITVDNLALEGNGIYIRLNGTVGLSAGSPVNLKLELMPGTGFMKNHKALFLTMFPFQSSPGCFILPVTGTADSLQLAVTR